MKKKKPVQGSQAEAAKGIEIAEMVKSKKQQTWNLAWMLSFD